jgi:alpha-N-arabinofuranosidase
VKKIIYIDMKICTVLLLVFSTVLLSTVQTVVGQANLPLYTDNLVNGFQNWSWATINVANTSPVYSGSSYSVSVTDGPNYQALSLQYPSGLNTSPYSSLTFWINGGASGGQRLNVYGTLTNTAQTEYPLKLETNTWQQITIPLSALGVAGKTNFSGIEIQGSISSAQPTFYVDGIQLIAAPAPVLVNLNVNAAQSIRTADARWFGLNTATWDGYLGNSSTLPALQAAGVLALRWPGGSTSDTYNWATDPSGNSTFMNIATNLPGAQVFTTANYGTGTPGEAAAWVLSANVTNQCGFKYWEIGNECYGTWEADSHAVTNDPYTYATNFATCVQLMKAADPTIKIGAVAVPGEDSYINNSNHFAVNPVTGQTHYGWTPVMLATLKNLGVTPDFLIYHFYPQYTPEPVSTSPPSACADSDPLLLQVSGNPSPSYWTDWASAASNLRQQITDYIGSGSPVTNIELCCTENNNDSSGGGKQLSGLVNALYMADSMSRLMQTEFNSYLFWDLRNGAGSDGSYDPTLYGWRTEGDFGVITGANAYNPPYYSMKLMQYFVRPGDTVLNATSDYLLLSAYAARKADGALTMLVINKDTTTNFNAQITLTNFVPWTNATIQSYGIPQDQAVEYGGPSAPLQDIATTNFPTAGTNFTYSFPALSLTLFTFAPAAPQLQSSLTSDGQFVLQVQGQAGVPYVVQTSPDLINWTPVSTNMQAGSVLSITNTISSGISQQFWRAVWQP